MNAEAVAKELAAGGQGAEVVVVGCGWEGRRASEDEAAAGAILHRLQTKGAELDERAQRVGALYLDRPRSALRNNSAARRLVRVGYEADLDFCLAEDTLNVAPGCSAEYSSMGKKSCIYVQNLGPKGPRKKRYFFLTTTRWGFTLKLS